MIKQLLNLLIAKYCDLSVSSWLIICLSLWLQQIIDLFAPDKVVIIKCGQQIGFKTQTRYVQHADWGLNCHIWPIYWQQKKEIETIQCKKPKSWNFIGEKFIQFLDRWVPFASPCKFDDVTENCQCIIITSVQPISENVLLWYARIKIWNKSVENWKKEKDVLHNYRAKKIK